MDNSDREESETSGVSRRMMLGVTGMAAGAAALGAAGGFTAGRSAALPASATYDFYGPHQSGILTPQQEHLHIAAFDVTTPSRDDLVALLRSWTHAAATLMAGAPLEGGSGEAQDLPASGLTVTFGFGRRLFTADGTDRFRIADRLPRALIDLPAFPGDELSDARSGGDLCVQACANDPQVAAHAIRNLTRLAAGRATLRWTQVGFGRASSTTRAQHTPRNLMGFKDGTRNLRAEDTGLVRRWLWADASDGHAWMTGGTYLVARRIRMLMDAWDNTAVSNQEAMVGRAKHSGAPMSGGEEFTEPDFEATDASGSTLIDPNSHIALAHPNNNGNVVMLRRGYNFMDGTTGQGALDGGLFFMAFVRDPRIQFVPIQERISNSEAMTINFLRTTGSAVFAIPPGVPHGAPLGTAGAYVGEALFS